MRFAGTMMLLLLSSLELRAQDFLFASGFEDRERPVVGAVIFTEEMSAPVEVPDTSGEWIEIANVGSQPADLTGCTVEAASGAPLALPDLVLPGGGVAVLARSDDPGANGGIAVVSAVFTFSLTSSDSLKLRCDGLSIDETSWVNDESPGRARSLAPDRMTASANDSAANWCFATTTYGDGDFGSPGMSNPACPVTEPTSPAPLPGEVRIEEIMPDPAGTLSDASAEWIELRHAGAARVGLETCVLDNAGASSSALSITALDPGMRLLVARSGASDLNGGLTADATFTFTLPNTTGTVRLVCGAVVIDQISYGAVTAGRSLLRSVSGTCVAPAGSQEYFPANFGTPRTENLPACP